MGNSPPANVSRDPEVYQFWKQRYLLALEGKFPCMQCGIQLETEKERLALRCEHCCPQ